jgi:hypothetical protein
MASKKQILKEGYTHYGWFGICPVYLGNLEDPFAVKVAPRWWSVIPLFHINLWIQASCIYLQSYFDPSYQPCWVFSIEGEIDDQ